MNMPLPERSGFLAANMRTPRWDERIEWYDIKENVWETLRFVGSVYMVAQHWLKTKATDTGKAGKSFPLTCLNYDPVTQSFNPNGGCPVEADFPDMKNHELLKVMVPRQSGYAHAIVRELQRNLQGDPQGMSMRPLRLPMGLIIALRNLAGLNKVVIEGKEYPADVTDPYYGRDVHVLYDPKAANPSAKYQVQLGDRVPLNDVEKSYLNRIVDWASIIRNPSAEEIKGSLSRSGYYQFRAGGEPGQPQGSSTHANLDITSHVLPPAPQPGAAVPPPFGVPGMPPAPPAMGSMPPPMGATTPQYSPPPQPQYSPPPPTYTDPNYAQPAPQQPQYNPPPQPQYSPPPPQPSQTTGAVPPPFAPPPPLSTSSIAQQPQAPQAPVYTQAPAAGMQLHTEAPLNPLPPSLQSQVAAFAQGIPQSPVSVGVVAPPTAAPQAQYQPPTQAQVAPAAISGGPRQFAVVGKGQVDEATFQGIINEYANVVQASNPRALPMKIAEKSAVQGMQVLNCFGAYKGDGLCLRCGLRKYCLQN